MSHPAAFIDRDGVLNEERAYVCRPEDFVLLPGAIEALERLQAAGYRRVVVTNQSGIARGLYSEGDYHTLTDHLRHILRAAGVTLDDIEYCPHLPDAPLPQYRVDCFCRKPRPGMLLRASRALTSIRRHRFWWAIGSPMSRPAGPRASESASWCAPATGCPRRSLAPQTACTTTCSRA